MRLQLARPLANCAGVSKALRVIFRNAQRNTYVLRENYLDRAALRNVYMAHPVSAYPWFVESLALCGGFWKCL